VILLPKVELIGTKSKTSLGTATLLLTKLHRNTRALTVEPTG